jgi:hypothetical protein
MTSTGVIHTRYLLLTDTHDHHRASAGNGGSAAKAPDVPGDFRRHKGRTPRYKHAARHVREIDSLNAQIKDYAGFETHEQFMARLLQTHPRKTELRGGGSWDF